MIFFFVIFGKRVDLIDEKIIAEVHYVGEENSWFAIGFSNYGELKPADYCIIWMDWHRDVKIQVNTIFINQSNKRN